MIVGGRDKSKKYHLKSEMMNLDEGWKVVADYPFTQKIRVGALGQGTFNRTKDINYQDRTR